MFEKLAVLTALAMAACALDAVGWRDAKRARPHGGGGGSNDDFEKFFLKASKSVPRIGRRRVADEPHQPELPAWADLSDLYEYNPELFASPQLPMRWLEYYNSQLPREDAPTQDEAFHKRRADDELDEYRSQP